MPIAPGDTLRNRYEVVALIGRGGMGEVFSARRVADNEQVAIKVVARSAFDDAHMARLAREAEAARRIRSAFVPEVFDVDHTDAGELFVVMRLLSGGTLTDRLRARGRLEWHEVRALVDDVLSGLIDAHLAGVVHRDLKPGNIFLEWVEAATIPTGLRDPSQPDLAREYARILDFGVCKIDLADGDKLTSTGETVGTVSYMSPEQIRGASSVDGRSDIYAAATVAYEALSGRLPFSAEGQMAMLAEKLEGRARHIVNDTDQPIPEGLDALLTKALSRDRDRRYASAAEMRVAWRALGSPLPIAIHEKSRQQSLPGELATEVTATTIYRAPVSRVGLGIAAGAAVIAMLALATLVLKRVTDTPAPGSAADVDSSALAAATPSAERPTSERKGPPDAAPASAAFVTELIEFADNDSGKRPSPTPRPRTTPTEAPPRVAAPSAATQSPHMTTKPRY